MKEPLIRLSNVSYQYRSGVQGYSLKRINFEIYSGELVVILGPSGAGKSTLLNLLGGLDKSSCGNIIVNGRVLNKLSDRGLTEYRARDVGFVFQFYNLIPNLTAFENVALIKNVCKDAVDPKAVLTRVGLAGKLRSFPSQLSGGEQQRVSIARALVKNPALMLCDEPTGALDSENGCLVFNLLCSLCRNEGKIVIIVTHNELIAQAADRVIRLKNGEIASVVINDTPLPPQEVVF